MLVACTPAAPAAPAAPAVKKPYEIAVVVKITGIPWFNTVETGVKRAASELNVNAYQTGPAQADPAQQVKLVEDLVAKGVDAIVVVPNDAKALEPVFKKAKEKGIKIITHESTDQIGNDYDFELIDNVKFGQHAWDQLVKHMGDTGEYAIFVGGLTVPAHNFWADTGIAYAKEKYPNLKLVTERIPCGEDQEMARQKTLELIKAYPNLKGIVGFGSLGPIGAAQALKEKGLSDKIAVVGTVIPSQAAPYLKEGSMKEGLLWNPANAGYGAVWLAKYMLDGGKIETGVEIPGIGKITVDGNLVKVDAIWTSPQRTPPAWVSNLTIFNPGASLIYSGGPDFMAGIISGAIPSPSGGTRVAEPFFNSRKYYKTLYGRDRMDHVDFQINKGEIHCLTGENGSGKSTIIKIISGTVRPDPGSIIEIEGQPVQRHHAIDAIHKGIQVIYQDLSLFPNLTVAENIALGQFVAKGIKLVNWNELARIARRAMERIGVKLPLDALVSEISIADQQLVAICRALTWDVKLLIMDEPTASLTKKEVDALLGVVKDMRDKGIATMFVSHKLNEVFQVAERVSVIRDGKMVGTYQSADLDDEKLTMLMTGKKVEYARFMRRKAKVSWCWKCGSFRGGANIKISLSSCTG